MYQSLQLRSDRITAICRLILAAMLIAASLLDPGFPIIRTAAGAVLLWSYLVYAAAVLVIACTDWWLTHRMRPAAFLIDVFATFASLYLIESAGLGLVSPFMGFFVFLVLTSTLIWRSRTVIMITAGLIVLYGLLGLALAHNGDLDDGNWFARRLAFMLILAALVIWFGTSRRPEKPDRLDWPHDAPVERRFAIIVDYIQRHMQASGVAIFWSPADEPWIYLGLAGIAGHRAQRLPPEAIALDSGPSGSAVLFDRRRHRRLELEDGDRIAARRGPARIDAADFLGLESGLLIPVTAETGSGTILLTGIRGVSADHLQPARALSGEIGLAIDRHALAEMSQAAQLERLRFSLARDLHDSVAQSLAGVGFRIAALRQIWRQGGNPDPELDALQAALTQEQHNLQDLIAQLRNKQGPSLPDHLCDALTATLEAAERRWGIETTLDCDCPDAKFSAFLLRETQQLIGEAIANAVKHGQARRVDLTVRQSDGGLELAVLNPHHAETRDEFLPQTISERVEVLGGRLAITSGSGHTAVRIWLPAANDL
ncbi:MAG: hypothetical protein J0L50_09640 [Sphingomonadales bacterium]|nr:hypothetical protein [Sphingomonadales bacterium]